MEKDPLDLLKQSLNQLLQADTSIKRKNKKIFDQKKDLFINLVNQMEYAVTKSYTLKRDYSIDLFDYEENYYQIIDSLIHLAFGKEIYELLSFYIYERNNEDGSQNGLYMGEDGEEIPLKNAEDLWLTVIKIKPNIFDEKR